MLLQIEDNRLTITGTDLEVELSSQTQLSSSSEMAPSRFQQKKFLDICRTLSDDSEITVTFEEDRALVQSGRSGFTLTTQPAEEYQTSRIGSLK